MGLFQNIFGNKSSSQPTTRFEMITDSGNGFYAWDGNLYKSDLVRAAIRPKAQAIGKLNPKHILDFNGNFKINPQPYIRFILEEPNPYMTMQMMLEKVTTQLMLNHNAFIYIKRDELGYATELYPIPATSVELIEGKEGDLFLRYTFMTGKRMTVPYSDIIHLRRDFNESDFFGDTPQETLKNLMEVVNTTDQGMVKAIKNSMVIKWIMKFKSTLRPEDRDIEVSKFVDTFLSINKGKGVAATDPRYDLEQIKNESYVPNAAQMDRAVLRIYSFFNTNENIIQSKYTEDEWNAYYEAEIEPLSKQLSGEFTRRIFSKKERGFGNYIIFEANSLQYASMATKLNLVQMVDRSAMTPNEWRDVMNLGPIEGGDKPLRRLDTTTVGDDLGGGEDIDEGEGSKATDDGKDRN
ncbi:phage portal protein [Clostridium beijerinckii]|uniref:HK97 family phage portal protein n=1 Tax=Clostridium beijerinckii TaxID=1520 RepID=A0A9Q5CPU8_CLOBE|nr:phage portal protein [Clostridium beijerinckii]AQS03515.1 phage portal protein [Clostridium beijerinckii]MBA2884771.1 HK97 family phage portal protein [Clostridium beijerinckii]MBA2899493.1 HK97 family phage portal protein [Clostridium beijerinckii]MBA2909122.1 HK97 family phage portal protein [Clostridium beijerinckii]MBC2415717.1 phage portal protein [Clostridium beijerinckii]